MIMRRNFAPAGRSDCASVIAREREIPRVLEGPGRTCSNPPRVYTEVALQQMPDTIRFFQHDVPLAFAGVKDAKLLDEFESQLWIAAVKP